MNVWNIILFNLDALFIHISFFWNYRLKCKKCTQVKNLIEKNFICVCMCVAFDWFCWMLTKRTVFALNRTFLDSDRFFSHESWFTIQYNFCCCNFCYWNCRWIWLNNLHFISSIGYYIQTEHIDAIKLFNHRMNALRSPCAIFPNIFLLCHIGKIHKHHNERDVYANCAETAYEIKVAKKKLIKLVKHLFQYCIRFVDVEMLCYYLDAAKQNIRNQSRPKPNWK